MKMIKVLGLTLAAAGMMTITAQAVAIQGDIGFTGLYTQVGGNLGDLTTATSMSINTISVLSDNGDLNVSTLISFAPSVGVNGNPPSLVGSDLWSVFAGGFIYTFEVISSVQNTTFQNSIGLTGFGIMQRNGLDDTMGDWQLNFGQSGASFTWQGTSATVPDGGATLILLGGAVLGLFGLARKSLANA